MLLLPHCCVIHIAIIQKCKPGMLKKKKKSLLTQNLVSLSSINSWPTLAARRKGGIGIRGRGWGKAAGKKVPQGGR